MLYKQLLFGLFSLILLFSSDQIRAVTDPCNQVFDVIIVGGGNAGLVLANRLTEDPNLKVLVIESGRDDTRLAPLLPLDLPNPLPNKTSNPWSVLPRLGPLATYGNNLAVGFDGWQHMPLLRNDPTSRQIFYSRGSTWGGCTLHNAGVALRGHSEIYDEWDVVSGNTGIWNYNALIPFFKKMENRGMHTAPFDAIRTGGLYFNPLQAPNTVGDFDPATQGVGGPITLFWFDLSNDPLAVAIKNAASVGPYPFGAYPGTFVLGGIPADVDPDNQTNKQYITSQPETGYDQFSVDFPALDPYKTGPVAFPNTYGPLSGVPPRIQRGHAAGYYLYPVISRPNLTVLSEALVTKVIFDNQNNAIGVQYLQSDTGTPTGTWNVYQSGRQMNTSRAGIGGTPSDATANAAIALKKGPKVARAAKEVILSAGVYNSPQILLLSGVGPSADLDALGIPVIKNLQGVGQHLVDHAETDICWFHETPFDFFADISAGQLPQSGLMTFDFVSDSSQPFGDFSAHVYPGGIVTGWGGIGDIMDSFIGNARYDGPPQYIYPFIFSFDDFTSGNQRYDPPLSYLTHTSILLEKRGNVRSNGFVKLRSADPTDRLNIVMNLLLDPVDMQSYVNAFRDTIAPFVQNLSAQGFFDAWVAPAPADFLTSGTVLLANKSNFNQAAFEQWVLRHLWAHHASGTCKMGVASDPMAVVDARLRVFGVQRLRVVDCSVFPVIPTSNTQIPAYVLAERAADLIKQDLPTETPITSINPLVDSLITNFN
jgi:choline dehydrogenase-like flavoprotein